MEGTPTCGTCKKKFCHKQDFDLHMLVHGTECEVCHKQFNERTFLHHVKKRSKDSPFNCNKCNKQFCTIKDLHGHKHFYGDECNVCHKQFTLKEHLTNHILQRPTESPFTCGMCKKQFCLKCDLTAHFLVHCGQRFECEICGKIYLSKSKLHIHFILHTGRKPHKCQLCRKRYATYRNLAIHCDANHKKKIKSAHEIYHVCKVCRMEFSNKFLFSKHNCIRVSEESIFCVTCCKKFSNKKIATHRCVGFDKELRSLKENVTSNSETEDENHAIKMFLQDRVCHVCDTLFHDIQHYAKHNCVTTAITEINSILCVVCRKKFTYNEFAAHYCVKAAEKVCTCNTCLKEFSDMVLFATHECFHADVSSFSCNVCHVEFSNQKVFNAHNCIQPKEISTSSKDPIKEKYDNLHSSIPVLEKSVTCSISDKDISDKESFTLNGFDNAGEKSITCGVSQKEFPKRKFMVTNGIHVENSFSCGMEFFTAQNSNNAEEKSSTCDVPHVEFNKQKSTVHNSVHPVEKLCTCNAFDKEFNLK